MTTKSLLKNNRVYLVNKSDTNYVYSSVSIDWNENTSRLYVDNTDNFTLDGYLLSMDGYYKYKYNSKGSNYFNIIINENNKLNNNIIFRKGVYVKQERNIITNNDLNNTIKNNKYNLSGWFSDGKVNQATLKVSEANVIVPGAIRFIKGDDINDGVNNGKFQGCISVNDKGESKWVEFNAIKGESGNNGNINTTLKYETIGSGEGELIKTNELEVNTENKDNKLENNKVLVRSITADNKIINGKECNNLSVRTDNNNVLIGLDNVGEVVYDLTDEFSNIKGNPETDKKLNCYGEQIRIRVCKGENVKKGQIVAISLFTENVNGIEKTYYGVKPMSINNCNGVSAANNIDINIGIELLKYQIGNSKMKYCFGLSREDGNEGDIINVLVNGIGILKIGNNISGMNTISTTNISYLGLPVLLDRNGYGFVCQDIAKLPDPHMEIGSVMEYGNIGHTDNYILIKFNPIINDL